MWEAGWDVGEGSKIQSLLYAAGLGAPTVTHYSNPHHLVGWIRGAFSEGWSGQEVKEGQIKTHPRL